MQRAPRLPLDTLKQTTATLGYVLLATLFVGNANFLFAQHAPPLFEPVPTTRALSAPAVSTGPLVVRQRLVKINPEALGVGDLPAPEFVELNPFPDTHHRFERVGSLRQLGSGNRLWQAKGSNPLAYAVLILGEHGVRGNISDGAGKYYKLLPLSGDVLEVREVVGGLVDHRGDAEVPSGPQNLEVFSDQAKAVAGPTAVAQGSPVYMDVLVAYTPSARQEIGGHSAIQALADATMAEMNVGLANSNVNARVRVAAAVQFTPPANEEASSSFLGAVTTSATLAALRDQYGADLVTVWIDGPASGGGTVGRAWIMTNVSQWFASSAFSVVEVNWVDGPSLSFAHEAGHNLGCAHDRDHAGVSGAFSYSYGYQQDAQAPRFYTIMAYSGGCSGCSSINYWSNPNVSYGGNPTGIASGSNSADNARTLNQSTVVAADWRDEVSTPSDNPSTAGVYADGRWRLDSNGNDVFDPGIDPFWIHGGIPGSQHVVGDWNGDGQDDVGFFVKGFWYLDSNGNGAWDGPGQDSAFPFGWTGVTPVVGDWNGDGRSSAGFHTAGGNWFVDYDGNGSWDGGVNDKVFGFGWPGVSLVVGDWNGDGKDKVGVFANGNWFLDYDGSYSWEGATSDKVFQFGWAGVKPMIGDWNGDGRDDVAVYSSGNWFLDYDGNQAWNPGGDRLFGLGWAGAQPVVGDWNGDGRDKAGVFSDGNWFLDHNGDGVWSTGQGDRTFEWGEPGDSPAPGRW